MRALGQVEGKTFRLDIRYAHGQPARSVALIRDALASRPDVLVVSGLTNARRAKEATKTVPVVVATGSDLVDAGIVASFARPGANITGITDLADQVAVKRLELLKELIPKLSRVALLNNPHFPATAKIESRVRAAAGPLGITVLPLCMPRIAPHFRRLSTRSNGCEPTRCWLVATRCSTRTRRRSSPAPPSFGFLSLTIGQARLKWGHC
jgi:putative tryptophan/tyrosine transport system substrate-binding protein